MPDSPNKHGGRFRRYPPFLLLARLLPTFFVGRLSLSTESFPALHRQYISCVHIYCFSMVTPARQSRSGRCNIHISFRCMTKFLLMNVSFLKHRFFMVGSNMYITA